MVDHADHITRFIIFGTFLSVYAINLPFLDQIAISLLDVPLRPVALILITMGIVSPHALGFRDIRCYT
jgi:hypothetical protein